MHFDLSMTLTLFRTHLPPAHIDAAAKGDEEGSVTWDLYLRGLSDK